MTGGKLRLWKTAIMEKHNNEKLWKYEKLINTVQCVHYGMEEEEAVTGGRSAD
jgi:hypothetical protein